MYSAGPQYNLVQVWCRRMMMSGEQGGAGHLGTIRSSSARTGMLIYNSLLTSQIIVVKNGPDIAYQDVTTHQYSTAPVLISIILGLLQEFH